MKVCSTCAVEKPFADYYLQDGKPVASCKKCKNLVSRNSYYANREARLEYARDRRKDNLEAITISKLRSVYRVSEAWLRSRTECEICGATEHLQVDHSHRFGFARGKLCNRCNTGLGGFRDRPELFAPAIEYLLRTEYSVKYRSKPTEIEASIADFVISVYHNTPEVLPDWIVRGINSRKIVVNEQTLVVSTQHGRKVATRGDYLIDGGDDLDVIGAEKFRAEYEEVV